MWDAIANNIVAIVSGVVGVVSGIIAHRQATLKNKADAISQLLTQNKELVEEINVLQDKVVKLSKQLAECQIEITNLRAELAQKGGAI